MNSFTLADVVTLNYNGILDPIELPNTLELIVTGIIGIIPFISVLLMILFIVMYFIAPKEKRNKKAFIIKMVIVTFLLVASGVLLLRYALPDGQNGHGGWNGPEYNINFEQFFSDDASASEVRTIINRVNAQNATAERVAQFGKIELIGIDSPGKVDSSAHYKISGEYNDYGYINKIIIEKVKT